MKICVIGLGYIGLPTAAMFSSYGCQVVGVDVKPEVVEVLNRGDIHIEEPGLAELMMSAVGNGNFKAALRPESADVYIVAVPTPNNDDQYMSCDLSYVLAACRSIIPYLKDGTTVIVESTIAPRSMDDYIKPLFEGEGFIIGQDIYLAHCPERVLPGQILKELIYNNRIVGGVTERCTEAAAKVYSLFVKGEIIKTEAKTAEMSKCMENTYRDVNIALANELSRICYDLDINVLDVIQMANKHPRVNIHSPGPGVGGHCLAVDPYFIYEKSPENANIIKMARETNDSMPQFVVQLIRNMFVNMNNQLIAVFGVTYKGDVDDMRESPALKVIELLKAEGYRLAIYDPHVEHNDFVEIDEAVQGADLILVLTDHSEFKTLDHKILAQKMRTPILLDTKNIVKQQERSGLKVINYGNASRFNSSELVDLVLSGQGNTLQEVK
ncbi:UDP-N-acetyl-D-mannosaminuronic acid dehydrogenase [Paenibacillus taihuensis]|uniref:UDP-N-acetyl-D-mannosaminuronic acid dehydrogenase n=1 Tax=Paenibacillus taihuensis TaxID=1156355 RepID=A0A3D9SB63_9BACL|nr:nucleotide sugar dehydrogenase [Paenibacillus taihuensis]REE90517.1 UDP-N-acetyl-D-mannosaminuronic acid dehydrogenase [Paenibacillus taihuensis]